MKKYLSIFALAFISGFLIWAGSKLETLENSFAVCFLGIYGLLTIVFLQIDSFLSKK